MSAEERAPDEEPVKRGEPLKRGRKVGDARKVVSRPDARYFRYGTEGTIVAKVAAIEPDTRKIHRYCYCSR